MFAIKLFFCFAATFLVFSRVNSLLIPADEVKFTCDQICRGQLVGKTYSCHMYSAQGTVTAIVRMIVELNYRFYVIPKIEPESHFCQRIAAADEYFINGTNHCPSALRSNMDEIGELDSSALQSNVRAEDMKRLLKELNQDSTEVLSDLESGSSGNGLRSAQHSFAYPKKLQVKLVLEKLVEQLTVVDSLSEDVKFHENSASHSSHSSHPSNPSFSSHPSRPSHSSHPSFSSHPSRPSHSSHSSHPSHPSRPSHPSHSSHPSRPSHSSHPSRPRYPGYPSQPDVPSYSDYPNHPDVPSYSDYPNQPDVPGYSSYPSHFGRPKHPSQPTNPIERNQFSYSNYKNPDASHLSYESDQFNYKPKFEDEKFEHNKLNIKHGSANIYDYDIEFETSNKYITNNDNNSFALTDDNRNYGVNYNYEHFGKRSEGPAAVDDAKTLATKLMEESSALLDELENSSLFEGSDKKSQLVESLLKHLTKFMDLVNSVDWNKTKTHQRAEADTKQDSEQSNNDDTTNATQTLRQELASKSNKRKFTHDTSDEPGECPLCTVVLKDVCSDGKVVVCNDKICCWMGFNPYHCMATLTDKTALTCYTSLFNILESAKLL